MELLKVDTLEQAREKLKEKVPRDWLRTYEVPIGEALGRTLAEDILCKSDIPDFRRSTVDGYAVRSKDTMGAGESIPVFLKIIEEVAIGTEAKSEILPGTCAYVPTGGMLPDGADSCVMTEYCEELDKETVAVYQSVSPNKFIVNIGEDHTAGSLLLKKGTMLRPQEIGAMAANGMTRVKVFEPWRVTVISTGDELVSPGGSLTKGKIFDINTHALSALAKKHGFEVIGAQAVADDEELLRAVISEAIQKSDLVAISGGSSKGKKDITAKLIDELSSPGVFTHGLAIKPGKPTILGLDESGRTLLVGLPGHPVAAMAVFEMLPVWLKKYLQEEKPVLKIPASLSGNVPGTPGRQMLVFVQLEEEGATYTATPIFGKSGLISTITSADGYAVLDLNREGLKSGEKIWVHKF